MKRSLVILFLVLAGVSIGQNTIGLVENQSDQDNLYLFNPEKSTSSYLINQCGELVNQWNFNERPGLTSYILEDGNILRAGKNILEIKNWDDNLIWSYDLSTDGINQHHDIEPLPNGNILLVVHDEFETNEIIDEGRDPSTLGLNFKMDKIIEIEPVGVDQINIVWEWRFVDHLIQDFDNTKGNFGVVTDHPELLDLNFTGAHQSDFTHVNGVDYNEELDQILLSARHTNELYIIDHSTTTQEAQGSAGGDYGKGGDFLWRFGNSAIYNGTSDPLLLSKQHDAKWILNDQNNIGKISVYNNGYTSTESAVHIVDPSDSSGYYKIQGNTFLPLTYEATWSGDILGTTMLEGKKCGVQVLPNSNFLITETSKGRFSEVSLSGDVLWSYVNPVADGLIYNQFETFNGDNTNTIFRGEYYPLNYPGFIGKDISGNGIIENENSITDNCTLSTDEYSLGNNPKLMTNILSDDVLIFTESLNEELIVMDYSGSTIAEISVHGNSVILPSLNSGVYLLVYKNSNFSERFVVMP